jgi:GT2 family glycosyltransferase/glycosyltransferase involved in cell wall biosynthesis
MTTIRFPEVDEPLVSVVMVTYGNWPLVRRSLDALLERTEAVYEVIVVDSASPDETAQRLTEEVEGANVVLSVENIGFGGGSNLGAEKARGRYVCFLNSDAIVEPGWLDPLLDVLEEDETAGAVVPMLLNPDGSIQEAGSVIDSIGWTLALGRGQSASDFAHRFRREIDYGSAACLLISRESFWQVDGFEAAYGIGYFEDVDLSFKLKERGLRTIYEPRSRVVHELHGSGTSIQARRRMEANRGVFYERWAERLSRRPTLVELQTNPGQLVAARDAEVLDRILVLDDRVPFHDRGSGDPRMAKLLNELVELWPDARITLAAADDRETERYAAPLLARGIEVVAPPVDWEAWFESRMFHYSVVIFSRGPNIARFEGFIRGTQPQALKVFDTEALSFRRLERMARVVGGDAGSELRAEAARMRMLELGAVDSSDVVFAVSDEESKLIAELAPDTKTFVLTHYIEPLPDPPGFEDRTDLIFFGGFLAGPGSPIEDAVLRLASEVMPRLWEREPELRLRIVGADTTPAVQALASEKIEVVGYVEDPTDWLACARVLVSPIRFAAGINLKLLDAMAASLPFVTTSIGAEGLPLGALRPHLVADEPAELADRVHALYVDQVLWERAQRQLRNAAESRFDRGTFRRTLVEAMSHLGVAPPAGVFDVDSSRLPRSAHELGVAVG